MEKGNDNGEQIMATREERKEMFARLKAERIGAETERHEREMKQRDLERRITYIDGDPEQLLQLGEIQDETKHIRPAQTILEEEKSVRLFATALHLEIQEGETLLHLLSRTYEAWCGEGSPLLNPLSGRFSQEFEYTKKGKVKSLGSVWTFLEPIEDYDKPLVADDPPKEPHAPVEGPAAVGADELFKELRRLNENGEPLMFYRAKIMPHCDE